MVTSVRSHPWRYMVRTITILQKYCGEPTIVRTVHHPDITTSYNANSQAHKEENIYIVGIQMSADPDNFTKTTLWVGDRIMSSDYALLIPTFARVLPEQNFALHIRPDGSLPEGSIFFYGWSLTNDALRLKAAQMIYDDSVKRG